MRIYKISKNFLQNCVGYVKRAYFREFSAEVMIRTGILLIMKV